MSRLIRRTHLYLALFLAPWMMGYALSTIVMGHRWTDPQVFVREREVTYDAAFPAGTSPRDQARQILSDLNLTGAFGVQGPNAQGQLTINRQQLVTPRRLVYSPADHRVTIDRATFQSTTFLNRFHHRRGYDQPFAADRAMAASIDLVVAAMVFWVLSGIWMWWEMRATRVWGALATVGGMALFAFYLWTL